MLRVDVIGYGDGMLLASNVIAGYSALENIALFKDRDTPFLAK